MTSSVTRTSCMNIFDKRNCNAHTQQVLDMTFTSLSLRNYFYLLSMLFPHREVVINWWPFLGLVLCWSMFDGFRPGLSKGTSGCFALCFSIVAARSSCIWITSPSFKFIGDFNSNFCLTASTDFNVTSKFSYRDHIYFQIKFFGTAFSGTTVSIQFLSDIFVPFWMFVRAISISIGSTMK